MSDKKEQSHNQRKADSENGLEMERTQFDPHTENAENGCADEQAAERDKKQERKHGKRMKILLTFALLALVFGGLAYWKRWGIYNFLHERTGFTLPYEILETQKTAYGYYEQEIELTADLDETQTVLENDSASDGIETTMTKEETLVETSLEIDEQIEAELNSGNYTWEEPLTILNPWKISPLTAVILFQTEEETAVRVTVKGKTEAADLTGEVEAATSHRVPVVGLYPDMENTVVLELLDEEGNITNRQEIKIQTESLPDQLQDMVKPVTTSGSSAFGLTIVGGQQCKYPYAFDCEGEIRWYLDKKTANYGVYPLSDGRLIFQEAETCTPSQGDPQATNLYEMDYLGRAYTLYYVPGGSHHEVIEKEPGGNLLTLTSSLKLHYENEIVELDRETGEIVNELELEDIFDTGSLFEESHINRGDWIHVNTVSYQAESDTIVISCRNLHSVIKLNWTTKEIQWILCDSRFWQGTEFAQYVLEPTEEFTYFFEQHSAYPLSADLDGNQDTEEIILFDNHFNADSPVDYYDTDGASFVKIYSIDEEAGTVTQLKSLQTVYSKITSNAIYDEESGHIFGMCGTVVDGPDGDDGMVYEFDGDTGEVLNQYQIREKFYRAVEMEINYQDLASAMSVDEQYIKGSLRPAVLVDQEAATPEETLPESAETAFYLTGSVFYVGTYDHQISQVIFKGENHTYVWDASEVHLYVEAYLDYYEYIPIPLGNLETDNYEILCVYQDGFYQTGESFTIS